MVRYWSTPEGLAKDVILSLQNAFETHPRFGWEKSLGTSNVEMNQDLIDLKKELSSTKRKLIQAETKALAKETDIWSKEIRLAGTCKENACISFGIAV